MNENRDRSDGREDLSPTDRLVFEAMSRPVAAATEQRLRARLNLLRGCLSSTGGLGTDGFQPSGLGRGRLTGIVALALGVFVCVGVGWMAWSLASRPSGIVDAPGVVLPSQPPVGLVHEREVPSTPTPLDREDNAPEREPSREVSPANDLDLAAIPPDDEGYGTVVGQFVLSGPVPVLSPLVNNKVPRGGFSPKCGPTISDESLVVDPQTKGIENVVVFLQKAPPSIPPSLAQQSHTPLWFSATCGQFVPHILFVQTDQVVACRSYDPLSYNVHTFPLKNKQENFIVAPLAPAIRPPQVVHSVAERLPFKVGNDIHVWMSAYWLVLDHPYAAITAKGGRFAIRQLPVGTHKFTVWHERAGYLNKSLEVTIESQRQTDLGVMSVAVTQLMK